MIARSLTADPCLCHTRAGHIYFSRHLSLAHMHGPHLDHDPFGFAILAATVRLHVAPGQMQAKDGMQSLIIGRLRL